MANQIIIAPLRGALAPGKPNRRIIRHEMEVRPIPFDDFQFEPYPVNAQIFVGVQRKDLTVEERWAAMHAAWGDRRFFKTDNRARDLIRNALFVYGLSILSGEMVHEWVTDDEGDYTADGWQDAAVDLLTRWYEGSVCLPQSAIRAMAMRMPLITMAYERLGVRLFDDLNGDAAAVRVADRDVPVRIRARANEILALFPRDDEEAALEMRLLFIASAAEGWFVDLIGTPTGAAWRVHRAIGETDMYRDRFQEWFDAATGHERARLTTRFPAAVQVLHDHEFLRQPPNVRFIARHLV